MMHRMAHMMSASMRNMSSALIVDDHPLFCDALSMTLRSIPGITEVTTADRLDAAMDIIADGKKPDIVLLDLNLPDVNGLDGLVRLRTAVGDVPILVVSSMADNRLISSVIQAGAAGFVPKHSPRDVLYAALKQMREGGTFLPEGFVDVAQDSSKPSSAQEEAVARLSTLTNQQARILQLICEGKLNKQIAFDLSIAETTVKAHVTAIMRKLGVQSRTQAVLLAGEASFANLLPSNPDSH